MVVTIELTDLAIPAIVGASTGLLIVILVLKNFSNSFKIKVAVAGFLTLMPVLAAIYVLQSMTVGVILGTLWAFIWLVIIAEKYTKDMPDFNTLVNPFNMKPHESASMSALMIAVIVFILGSAASIFAHSSMKISIIGFTAPPLLGALSFITCAYFITKFDLETEPQAKQHYLKELVSWWNIGITIMISTIIGISFFLAVATQTIIAA